VTREPSPTFNSIIARPRASHSRDFGLVKHALNLYWNWERFTRYTERAVSAIRALVIACDRSGDIHKDFDPIGVVRASIGVANVATSPDWQHSAKWLVDTLIIGSCQTTYAGLGSSESSL